MARRREEEKYDYLVKVVIIGDQAVGKTNILLRYVNQEYKMSHISTIGVDFKIKTITVDGVRIKMQIWDTAGQQRFKTITETYYKGAAGVILVYSVTDRKTFHSLQNWIKQINDTQPENMTKIIVGNKSDCTNAERQVTAEEGLKLAREYGAKFVESSAKENINIQEIFTTVGKEIKTKLKESEQVKGPTGPGKDPNKFQIKGNGQSGEDSKTGKKCDC